MQLKIISESQEKNENSIPIKLYETSYDQVTIWVKDVDFIACNDLIEVKQSSISLKEPLEENYSLKKILNDDQENFLLIPKLLNKFQPKIETLEDGCTIKIDAKGKIYNLNKEGPLFVFSTTEKGNVEAGFSITQSLNKGGFSRFWSTMEMVRAKVTIFPEPKNCEEESKDDLVDINEFFSKKANEASWTVKVYPKNEVDKTNTNASKSRNFPDSKFTSAKNDLKTTATTDQKIAFINGLINLSSKRNVDDKTREKLFGLIGKELGKTGTMEEEILREVREIREGLGGKFVKLIEDNPIVKVTGGNIEPPKKTSQGMHKPKDVAEFMQLFENRSALKWFTHEFDESENDFDILTFLSKSKVIFNEFMKTHYLPKSLWSITNAFAFSENPKWGDKYKITQGWSTKAWIDWSTKEKMHPMKNINFYDVIQEFRSLTRIESPQLERLLKNEIQTTFDDKYDDFETDLIDCQKADFYTNTMFFKKAIFLIFEGILKRHSVSNKCSIKFSREIDGIYRKKTISICHYNSFLTKPLDELINEISGDEKGDFNSIKNYLHGYCDWVIETIYDEKPVRITILGESDGVTVDSPDPNSIVEGFTHKLIFYTK